MKKTIKFLAIIAIMSLLVGMLTFNVSAAASVTTGGGEYTVGQSVSIPIKITSDAPIMTAQVKISYNSSVLTLKSVSGAEYTSGNGTINIVDDNFSNASKDVTTGSYTLNFTAAAAGNSNIAVNVSIADKNLSKSTASASAAVTVVTPKPSSNANLSSIKLSSGSLSPAFNSKTTNYNVTVKYGVDTITITGAVADGGATYTGGGTFGLQVGDNQRVLTVTAADGTKKSYTINIKRMTEQETADAEQAERDANPLLVVINNTDYTIVNDFTNISIPTGFTQGTATRKEAEITVLNDEHGEYTLYWLVDAAGENGAFYTRDENDNFTRINYINANGKMYIIEEPEIDGYLPGAYTKSTRIIDGVEVKVYNYTDSELKDFCVVKCYVGGTRAYYQFDAAEGTMQRAVEFDLAVKRENAEPQDDEKTNTGKFAWFVAMSKTGKVVFIIIVFVAVLLVAVAILLIVKLASSRNEIFDDEEEYVPLLNNDFVIGFSEDEPETVEEQEPETIEEQEPETAEEQESETETQESDVAEEIE